jgi:hypothetical protein
MTNNNLNSQETQEVESLSNIILGDEETLGNETVVLYEVERQGFMKQNGTTIAIAGSTTIAGFIGGYFTGQYREKKKRTMFMEEARKQITLFTAASIGLETVEWNGIELPTAAHGFNNPEDVKAIIVQDYLRDNKVSEVEKAEWRALLLEMVTLGETARATQILKEREIVTEVKEEDAN